MNDKSNYEKSVEKIFEVISKTIKEKHSEYATNDDYHNFRSSSILLNETIPEAIVGMMVKHTISIYDMVCEYAKGANFEFEKWEEKIKDHIIYLINLYCYLDEENKNEKNK